MLEIYWDVNKFLYKRSERVHSSFLYVEYYGEKQKKKNNFHIKKKIYYWNLSYSALK